MTQADERSALAALMSSMVTLGNEAPMAEKTTPTPGAGGQASRFDHRHPRLTSPHTGVLDLNGEALIIFARQFLNMPAQAFGWVEAANNPPVMFKVVSWLKPNMAGNGLIAWTSGAPYAGAVIKGYRGQPLPQLVAVSGLLTSVITGVNGVVNGLTNYNVFAGNASGVSYSATFIQVGDDPPV